MYFDFGDYYKNHIDVERRDIGVLYLYLGTYLTNHSLNSTLIVSLVLKPAVV